MGERVETFIEWLLDFGIWALFLAILGGAALAIGFLWPASADAQVSNCAAHDVVAERLADGWGETRQAIMLGRENTVIEIWANPETGSWSLTVTRPGGPTCLGAAGEAFQLLAEALDEGEPT